MGAEPVPEELRHRYGPEVVDWYAAVPSLAARVAAQWRLTLGEPVADQGASSVTMHCVWPDGAPAILKLSPDLPLLAEQVETLRMFAATGRVPAVLAADQRNGAVVMSAVVPGTAAAAPTVAQWAELLAGLHTVAPPADPARDLHGRMTEAFARVGRRLADPAVSARLDRALWDRAIRRCELLLASQHRQVLLHGDLHLGNVLDGGSRGLIAIDPKACVGDPCFDAVDFVLAGAGQEGVATRCSRTAAAGGLDAERLYDWCRVIAPMLAIAELRGSGPEPVVAELLALASRRPGDQRG